MRAELRDFRLHLYPETIREFQEIHLWIEVHMPINAFIHRPVHLLHELRQQLLTNYIDENDNCPHP
jgi:hypothetical protein